jgi:hypothetical protein
MAKRSVARPAQKLHRPSFTVIQEESIFLQFVLMAFRAVSERSQDRALSLAASLHDDLKGGKRGDNA